MRVTPESVTHAAMDAAAELTKHATTVSLPLKTTIASSLLVTFAFGMYRRDYTVSYGYGAAVATAGALILKSLMFPTQGSSLPMNSLAVLHALLLIFYGVRLNSYLFFRRSMFPSFFEMREHNEKPGPRDFHKRIPFIIGCSLLYFCLAAPALLTSSSSLMQSTKFGSVFKDYSKDPISMSRGITATFLMLTFASFLVETFGDLQKSWVKAKKGGSEKDSEHVLVTSGIYRYLRHPNYTGELIGWTTNALAGLSTLAFSKQNNMTLNWINGALAGASVLGVLGMIQVLTMATSRLEQKQSEKYGEQPEYKDWIKHSWVGFTAPSKKKNKAN